MGNIIFIPYNTEKFNIYSLNNKLRMNKFILYLPYSEFIDTYEHKALGAIPVGFRDTGYDSQLIVGIMKSERYKKLGIKIYETGNLDTEYVDDYSEMNLMKRIKNFLNIRELIPVLKILIREKPDIFMAYNNSTLTGLIVFLYKVYCKIFLVHTRLILKLDNDGSSIATMPGARKKLINLYYGYLSVIFQRILTETTCGYDVFKEMPALKKRLRVVPNSVSNEFLSKYDPVKRQRNIITVSRITPDKGLDILIKSFYRVSSSYPAWNLEIIGEITDNEEYNKLIKLIDELGLGESVKFSGIFTRIQLIEKYRSSAIFCLASLHESFAISRLEAISQGMYVISTTAGCAMDFLKYGLHIVPESDIESLGNAIKEGIKTIESGEFKFNTENNIISYAGIANIISNSDF